MSSYSEIKQTEEQKEKKKKDCAYLAYQISQKFNSIGVPMWLEYGAALGAAREGGVVKDDFDIDMGIWWKDWGKLKNVFFNDKSNFCSSCRFNFIKCASDGEYCYINSTPVIHRNEFHIDIWGFEEYDGIRSSAINYNKAFRSKLYYQKNLKNIKFEGLDFFVSKYAEKYLDYIYKDAGGKGVTWRTPVKEDKENWEKTIPSVREEDKLTGCAEGAFDLYHKGHTRLFKKMSQIFDKVIVAVDSDELAESYKGKPPVFSLGDRIEILKSVKYIDEVISPAENGITTINWMEENGIDYMVHGKTDEKFLRLWYDEPMNEERLLLLDETPDYHTADLIKRIS